MPNKSSQSDRERKRNKNQNQIYSSKHIRQKEKLLENKDTTIQIINKDKN